MAVVQTFRELKVYRAGLDVARQIFSASQAFPREERYSLTDQIRRSSRAVCAMLAEAWARRRYPAAFIDKINQALGETMESQAWLDHARGCSFLSAEEFTQLDDKLQHIGAMLSRMIERAEDFRPSASSANENRLREEAACEFLFED